MTTATRPAELVDARHPADGRHRRRERNRAAVIDALLQLVDGGELDPTIVEVAAVAGLSARSVFRYFDDVDDLVTAAIARHQARLAPLFVVRSDPGLDLAARVRTFTEDRVALLEAMGNVGRLARLRAPVQPLVATELARVRARLRDQLRQAFAPELDGREGRGVSTLAAADVVCSFEAYEALRRDHHLDRAVATDTMAGALAALLATGAHQL